MTKPQDSSASKKSVALRMLPGLIVSALAIIALSFFVDINELRAAFALADFKWLPFVLLSFLGTLMARSMAWRTLLEEKVKLSDSFFTLNQGYLLNNILPFRLGEFGRALLLGERSGLNFWRVFSTIVVERVCDLGFAALLIVIAIPNILDVAWARTASSIALTVVALGFAVLFMLARSPKIIIDLITRFTRPWAKAQSWILAKMNSFMEGLASLRDIKRFARVSFWMALAWLFNLAWYFLLLKAFFPESIWLWAVMAVGAGSLGVAIPSSPAYIGVLEGAIVAALSLFGVPPALSLAYALVAHVLYFVVTGLIGAWGFSQQGVSLSMVYQRLLNRSANSADQ
jgi:uncharacterized protein (TIRG00374 family)